MRNASTVRAEALCYAVAEREIFADVSFDVPSQTSLAVTGPSGTGKTTLILCLAGILPLADGRVWINGQELTSLSPRTRSALRLRSVGLVYQFGELLPKLTPLENVTLPALLDSAPRRASYERGKTLLHDLGVGELADAATATLSGGERQRVAVARALITRPGVILADEPTGSLDSASGQVVSDLLFDLPRRYGCALIVVTHNDRVAARGSAACSRRGSPHRDVGG
ncbi:ABC transporter ATP-binding protein [Salinispora fenicalii]|uniref:ABC transporter ATP-binding protein n=1 Tax=Salinispora fenicalii TaxID=1137263 RepID=UPI001CC6399C|nr:ATP-binding cassette domain-containing protein [Salinispora fenicalii]